MKAIGLGMSVAEHFVAVALWVHKFNKCLRVSAHRLHKSLWLSYLEPKIYECHRFCRIDG